jgi:hypothetical protein
LPGPKLRLQPATSLREVLTEKADAIAAAGLEIEPLDGSLDPGTAGRLAAILGRWSGDPSAFFYFWNGLGFFPDLRIPLYYGTLEVVDEFFPGAGAMFQSPNLWWPEDRSWFGATLIDGTSTYMGGPEGLIESVVTSPEVEAIHVSAQTQTDEWIGQVA